MTPVDQAEQLIKRGGHVHLMGIGGIGMAGVAWLLKERGLTVSGCDLQSNRQTEWLSSKGIPVLQGHHDAHLADAVDWLIRSTAVSDTHPEVQGARKRDIPVSRRGDVLPALMRDRICIAVSGTHGKTTTTAMIAQLLQCGYCVGGEIVGVEGVARDGDIMVVEADESDGTVTGYTPDYAVITNIEYDHMEHHASEAAFIGCFDKLIQNTGKKVFFREDDPIAAKLCANHPRCESFRFPDSPVALPLPGNHNQWNAAAAMAVAGIWKRPDEILGALAQMKPLRRRFETVWDDRGIQVVSDYAHHPTEIAALIDTARAMKPQRLLAVFQPHRYTRTLALGPDFPASFEGLDRLWLVPVYAASEQPIEGGTTKELAGRFSEEWESRITCCPSLHDAWSDIRVELRAGDLLLIIGAGDIEQLADWARGL